MTSALTAPEQWYGCNPAAGPYRSVGPNGPSPVGLVTDAAQAAVAISSSLSISTSVGVGAAAGPIGAAIGALVALGFGLANVFSGCGETCTQATTYANAAEEKLNQMLAQWNGSRVHTRSMQKIYLTIVVGVFNALCGACGQSSLGSAGQRCISERLVLGGSAPWCPTGTGCDWVTAYYIPVANATDIIPDQSAPSSTVSNLQLDPTTNAVGPQPSAAPARDNSATYIVAGIALAAFIKYRKAA
jgi:hypothetical protein